MAMAQPKSPMSYTTEHVSRNQSEHLNTPTTDSCSSSRSSLSSKKAALSTDLLMGKDGKSRDVNTVSPTTHSPAAQNCPLQDDKQTQVPVEKDVAPDQAEEGNINEARVTVSCNFIMSILFCYPRVISYQVRTFTSPRRFKFLSRCKLVTYFTAKSLPCSCNL